MGIAEMHVRITVPAKNLDTGTSLDNPIPTQHSAARTGSCSPIS